VRAVLACGLLRVRSFNALEPKLHEAPFQKLVRRADPNEPLGSADTLSRSLRRMELPTVSLGATEN
jgi:hypothetical protein